MRWQSLELTTVDDSALPGLGRIAGLVRSVRTPDFAGVTFHEVNAKSVLNRVPGNSPMPFDWTINPMRGCVHACTYCFARRTHEFLEFDAGRDFDTEIVVKVNAADVLERELRRSSWQRWPVALGTNTDPYQRPEGRYRLMPGIISALAASGTPLSILTKGTLLRRDLPLLVDAAQQVPVGIGVSLAVLDPVLHQRVEPGTPSPRARLELIRAIADAGFDCTVMVAPVLPYLTDSAEQLERLVAAVAAAGATRVIALPLHLRPGTKEWFLLNLGRDYPDLLPRYRELYGAGAYAGRNYRDALTARLRPLLARFRLDGDDVRRPAAGFRGPRGSPRLVGARGSPSMVAEPAQQPVLF